MRGRTFLLLCGGGLSVVGVWLVILHRQESGALRSARPRRILNRNAGDQVSLRLNPDSVSLCGLDRPSRVVGPQEVLSQVEFERRVVEEIARRLGLDEAKRREFRRIYGEAGRALAREIASAHPSAPPFDPAAALKRVKDFRDGLLSELLTSDQMEKFQGSPDVEFVPLGESPASDPARRK